MPNFITVTAPKDRKVAIHPNDAGNLQGGLLYVEAGRVTRVRWSQDIRRSVNRGDLIPCNINGTPVPLESASAPEPLDTGAHVTEVDIANAAKSNRPPSGNMDASKVPAFDTSDEGKR